VRLVDPGVLDAAERAGAVRYGMGCVAFCGYDPAGRLRNVCFRSTGALTPRDWRTWNLTGSDKGWPMVLPGDPGVVWIVEGGVDGLAVQSLYRRAGWAVPTVVVSGGIRVLRFLEGAAAALRAARTVRLARERERDAAAQEIADRDHEAQKRALTGVLEGSGAVVRIWEPPAGAKDVADHAAALAGGRPEA
jgi:hypothetical protein